MDESRTNRILPDVFPFLLGGCLVSQPVIEESRLPLDTEDFELIGFPGSYDVSEALVWRNGDYGVEVIRHDQYEFEPPSADKVIVLRGIEESRSQVFSGKCIAASDASVDRDEELRARFHPQGWLMMKPRPFRQFGHGARLS